MSAFGRVAPDGASVRAGRVPVDRTGAEPIYARACARRGSRYPTEETNHDPGRGDIVTKLSPHPVADTVSKLTGILSAKGIRLFAVIDQSAEARQAGLSLRETTLVIFGNPAAGTPVMVAAPLAALDLPLKVVVWDDDGRTKVSYYSPDALAARHHLGACPGREPGRRQRPHRRAHRPLAASLACHAQASIAWPSGTTVIELTTSDRAPYRLRIS